MSAPYWGKLPAPKPAMPSAPTARQNRRSGDHSVPVDYGAPDEQPRRHSQRFSVQTTNTEAPTESTFNPYDSPTASSFVGHGLAPRPPSYQTSTPDYPPDIADKRSYRRTRVRDEIEHLETPSPAPPAAPDVPKAPPLSYRNPYSNSNTPDPYAAAAAAIASASRAARASASPPVINMDRQDPQPSRAPRDDRRDYFSGSHNSSTQDPGASPPARIAGEIPLQQVRKGSVREVNTGRSDSLEASPSQPRRTSLASQSGTRRKFADDQSPLKRLELTLGSITKEEKRARVEAAEKRSREKAQRATDAAKHPPTSPRQAQPKERQPRKVSHTVDEMITPPRQYAILGPTDPPVSARRGPLTLNPPREPKTFHEPPIVRSAAVAAAPIHAPAPDLPAGPLVVAQTTAGGNMGIPKRNLSFRERAAQKDIKPPPNEMEFESPTTPPTAPSAPSGGFLSRSGSNKLKKDPPGDPWYRLRLEAERALQAEQSPPKRNHAPAGPVNGHAASHRTTMMDIHPSDLLPASGPDVRRFPQEAEVMSYTDEEPQPGVQRHLTEPMPATTQTTVTFEEHPRIMNGPASDSDPRNSGHVIRHREFTPGDGLYLPPKFLEEWKQATVGSLSGALLNLTQDTAPSVESDKAWWEAGSKKRTMPSRSRKAEAFDGEYAETNGPTRFKPPLYLECGPLLRYCGIRRELAAKSVKKPTIVEREIWRGTVMIVTRDAESSYDIAPTLRLFVQPIELLPPPPVQVNGDLSPEYVDPIAGHPKLGRRGETLYVRPVEHLEEGRDLSGIETDDGLYEASRSPPDVPLPEGVTELPGSYASRHKRIQVDGEKVAKYKDVRGFRLHNESGYTFWRFNVEVELAEEQQRIAYRINRGPALGFWVPPKGKPMSIMFHSCNGFSLNVERTDDFSGPDPLWRDVLNTHQTQPFHVMVGGGGQIYNDSIVTESRAFREWSEIRNPLDKYSAPFTPEMQAEIEGLYLAQYCRWFSKGLFSLASSQIPMVNMFDDHEIIDGYGSYPPRAMGSPIFTGLGAVAFKYYMLFQHHSTMDETEATEPSWILGVKPGHYIKEKSRSIFVDLGTEISLLAVDCRTERTEFDIVAEKTWERLMDRCYKDVKTGVTKHLLVVLPVPIAYPRLVWLENILTSKLMGPVKALGKSGAFGSAIHQLEGGGEVRDDLNDHWTAKNHKGERRDVIEQLQDLAAIKSVRVTILSGDVNLAAVGQFYSHRRFQLPKHKDYRYMPNIIASPMVNSPPANLMADMINKRNKIHHFDKDTEEDMIPLFTRGVEGKPRNNKHLLPHRNWCSIRVWAPGSTPPATPAPSLRERSVSPQLPPPPSRSGSLLRRFSRKNRSVRHQDGGDSRPPLSASASGGLFRSFSRRSSQESQRPATSGGKLIRSLSVNKADFSARKLVGLHRPQNSYDGGAGGNGNGNGNEYWPGDGGHYDDDYYDPRYSEAPGPPLSRLRGGGDREYEQGDEALFTARPSRQSQPQVASAPTSEPSGTAIDNDFVPKPFHRTPTGLSTKQRKRADAFEVDLQGGLDISLNVEVNPKDPAGITVPYRLLVPRLFHDEEDEKRLAAASAPPQRQPSAFKRLLSFRGKKSVPVGTVEKESVQQHLLSPVPHHQQDQPHHHQQRQHQEYQQYEQHEQNPQHPQDHQQYQEYQEYDHGGDDDGQGYDGRGEVTYYDNHRDMRQGR